MFEVGFFECIRMPNRVRRLEHMRDLDVDAELRLISLVRDAVRSDGVESSSVAVDCLLDERHRLTHGRLQNRQVREVSR